MNWECVAAQTQEPARTEQAHTSHILSIIALACHEILVWCYFECAWANHVFPGISQYIRQSPWWKGQRSSDSHCLNLSLQLKPSINIQLNTSVDVERSYRRNWSAIRREWFGRDLEVDALLKAILLGERCIKSKADTNNKWITWYMLIFTHRRANTMQKTATFTTSLQVFVPGRLSFTGSSSSRWQRPLSVSPPWSQFNIWGWAFAKPWSKVNFRGSRVERLSEVAAFRNDWRVGKIGFIISATVTPDGVIRSYQFRG